MFRAVIFIAAAIVANNVVCGQIEKGFSRFERNYARKLGLR